MYINLFGPYHSQPSQTDFFIKWYLCFDAKAIQYAAVQHFMAANTLPWEECYTYIFWKYKKNEVQELRADWDYLVEQIAFYW